MASIALIDDDAVLIATASEVLQKAGFDLSVHGNLAAASVRSGQFDCVICNVNGKQAGGYELLRRRKVEGQQCPVILVSLHNDVDMAMQAIRLGAMDFLVKPIASRRLLQAVRSALREGERRSDEARQISVLRERYANLTERQQQTMTLLLRGKTNKEIASELSISARTVEIYRAWVMTKMDAPSLVHLVRIGIRLGME